MPQSLAIGINYGLSIVSTAIVAVLRTIGITDLTKHAWQPRDRDLHLPKPSLVFAILSVILITKMRCPYRIRRFHYYSLAGLTESGLVKVNMHIRESVFINTIPETVFPFVITPNKARNEV